MVSNELRVYFHAAVGISFLVTPRRHIVALTK